MDDTLRISICWVLLLLTIGDGRKTGSRFTNIKCESYHLDFAKVENCRLKVIGRNIIGINILVRMYKLPIHQIDLNLSMYRRYNGYKPFLYNLTFDFCKFMKQIKRRTFGGLMFGALASGSNVNHSCPYDHDIIVDNLVFNDTYLERLPLPSGEYMIKLRFASKNIWRLQYEVYILRDEL